MSVHWDLEQMRLFVSVAEQRSFSAVARGQRKAQSAVSSGIALLEADLGVVLFERSSGRQPRLTEAGSVLLEEAREVLRQCERLTGRALSLTRGEEACLRLAQDEAMLFQPVLDSLEALAVHYPLLLPQFRPWPALADLVAGSEWLVPTVTWGTLALQLAFPLLLLQRHLRTAGVAGALAMHVGIAVVMGLPFFSLFMMAGDCVFLGDEMVSRRKRVRPSRTFLTRTRGPDKRK